MTGIGSSWREKKKKKKKEQYFQSSAKGKGKKRKGSLTFGLVECLSLCLGVAVVADPAEDTSRAGLSVPPKFELVIAALGTENVSTPPAVVFPLKERENFAAGEIVALGGLGIRLKERGARRKGKKRNGQFEPNGTLKGEIKKSFKILIYYFSMLSLRG